MLRVLLLIDDYNELVYIQTLLKKMGFDVDGSQHQRNFSERLLTFNPHVLVTTASGRKVDGIAVVSALKKRDGVPFVILLKPTGSPMSLESLRIDQVDELLESPINARELLVALSKVGDLDPKVLLEKYIKMRGLLSPDEDGELHILKYESDSADQEPDSGPASPEDEEIIFVKGAKVPSESQAVTGKVGFQSSSLEVSERKKRFEKFIAETEDTGHENFPRERVMAYNKEIRATENPEELEELEEERRNFVRHLFRRDKK